MTQNVSHLKVAPRRAGEPQANVIEGIENLLARAKSGELQSIVAVYACSNGYPGYGEYYGNNALDWVQIAAGLALARREVIGDVYLASKPKPEPPPDEPA